MQHNNQVTDKDYENLYKISSIIFYRINSMNLKRKHILKFGLIPILITFFINYNDTHNTLLVAKSRVSLLNLHDKKRRLLSRLLMNFDSLLCKKCGPRSYHLLFSSV